MEPPNRWFFFFNTKPMPYYIDLSAISLDEYKDKLAASYLPPSRMILKERMDERFKAIKACGIMNVAVLKQVLTKKNRQESFGDHDCLTADYLTILLREIKSIHPKPSRIAEFSMLESGTAKKLERLGIKNTVKLYDLICTPQQRDILSQKSGLPVSEIVTLARLTDLSRIKWVGPTFAQMLYELGYDSLEKACCADADLMHEEINELNDIHKYYRAHISLRDIHIFIQCAKELPLDIVY